jgi:ribosomal protein S18 acetylase RimI-like enzyme
VSSNAASAAHPLVIVRDAIESDADTLVRFNLALSRDSNDKSLNPQTLASGVVRALRSSLCRYFVAERIGVPVGCVMVTYEPTDWEDGVVWWLQSVYVSPESRGTGVLQALFSHVRSAAEHNPDARLIRLYVLSDNTRALRAYAKLGMQRTNYEVYELKL